jgi:hypothetical protein
MKCSKFNHILQGAVQKKQTSLSKTFIVTPVILMMQILLNISKYYSISEKYSETESTGTFFLFLFEIVSTP